MYLNIPYMDHMGIRVDDAYISGVTGLHTMSLN